MSDSFTPGVVYARNGMPIDYSKPSFTLYGGKRTPYEVGDFAFLTMCYGDFFRCTFGPPNWARMNLADFPFWFHDEQGNVWINCNELYGAPPPKELLYEFIEEQRLWDIREPFRRGKEVRIIWPATKISES